MVALKFALAIPAISVLSLGAVDLHSVHTGKAKMQDIADAAALAGAKELGVAMDDTAPVERAKAWVASQLAQWPEAPAATTSVEVIQLPDGVKALKVDIDGRRPSFFGSLLPPGGWNMDAQSIATSIGVTPLCVLAHGARGRIAVDVKDASRIDAPRCMVHSNKEIQVQGRIAAEVTQSVDWARGNITPAPNTGAAKIEDPFKSLPLNPLRLCNQPTVTVYDSGVHYLQPGVHCGVVNVQGDAELILRPGDHWFMLGALVVKENARLTGQDVVLLFDVASKFEFKDSAEVNLDGRKSGPFAGFVMAASRGNFQDFIISSDQVEALLGVIYVPEAKLIVEGSADVARQSDWTVIVAKYLELKGSPQLFINADYAGSPVPVPDGVGPRQGGSRLIK